MRFFHDDIGFLKSIKRETTTHCQSTNELPTDYQPPTTYRIFRWPVEFRSNTNCNIDTIAG